MIATAVYRDRQTIGKWRFPSVSPDGRGLMVGVVPLQWFARESRESPQLVRCPLSHPQKSEANKRETGGNTPCLPGSATGN